MKKVDNYIKVDNYDIYLLFLFKYSLFYNIYHKIFIFFKNGAHTNSINYEKVLIIFGLYFLYHLQNNHLEFKLIFFLTTVLVFSILN